MYFKFLFIVLLINPLVNGIYYITIYLAGFYQYNPNIQQRLEEGRQWQEKIKVEQSDCWKVYYTIYILDCCQKS